MIAALKERVLESLASVIDPETGVDVVRMRLIDEESVGVIALSEHNAVRLAYCSIHESMNATIFVAPGPHHALIRPDGRFEMKGVPTGRYRLSTWCERLPATQMEIVVEADSDLEVEVQLLSLTP